MHALEIPQFALLLAGLVIAPALPRADDYRPLTSTPST